MVDIHIPFKMHRRYHFCKSHVVNIIPDIQNVYGLCESSIHVH